MFCKNCGAKLHDEANFCMKCGTKVEVVITCQNCGTELPEEADFCFKCGAKQIKINSSEGFDICISNTEDWKNIKYELDLDKITSIKVMPGVEDCPNFYNLRNLRTVSLPSTIKSIGHQAFCLTAIDRIVIPDSVTNIGSHAFECCKNLTYVKMSDNVNRISLFAFLDCPNLQYIEYKNQKLSESKFMDIMKTDGKTVFD